MKQILTGLFVTIVGGVIVWALTKENGDNYPDPSPAPYPIPENTTPQSRCSDSFELRDGKCKKTVSVAQRKFSIPLDKSVTKVSGTLHFRINKERVDFSNRYVQHNPNRGVVQVDLPIMLDKTLVGRATELIYDRSNVTICSISGYPESTGWSAKIGASYTVELKDCGTKFAKKCSTNLLNSKRAEIYLDPFDMVVSEDSNC